MRRIMVWILLCVCYGISAGPHKLDTIEHIGAYLKEMPEAPQADGNDWYNPSFYYFFYEHSPTVLESLGQMLGIVSPMWDARELQEVLRRVTKQRSDITFTENNEGEPTQEKVVKEQSECLVWGDLHAAVHSLYRSLLKLYQDGKINNELQIQQDDVYFEILGDAIDRSPYCLEILTIILHLMEQNPNNVMYTQGAHEKDAYWMNFATREALKWKASHLSDEAIPLHDELNQFFATLPRVIYMYIENEPDHVIHFSHGGRNIQGFEIDQEDVNAIQRIVATVRGEARFDVFHETHGLELLGFRYGSTEWSLLSCPVWVYQKFFNFTHDAFSSIQLGRNLDEATISLYNRPVDSEDQEFTKAKTYDLTSGQRLETGQEKGTRERFSSLRIGSSIAISRGLGMQGRSLERGLSAAVNKANNNAGVDGYMLRPFIFDDQYLVYRALQNVKRLLEDFSTRLFVAPTGTPTLEAYDHHIRKNNGAVLFPVTGAPQFRSSDKTYMVHFRPSYADEAHKLTQHIIDEFQAHKMALFYQDDDFGRALRDGAIATLKENGITDWLEVPYLAGQVDFEQQAAQIREYNPSTIGFFSTVSASKELIRDLTSSFMIGKPLFGSSDLSEYSFRLFARDQGVRFLVALAVPDPHSDLPLAQEFREQMNVLGWPYDVFAFEGYIAIQLLGEAMRNVDQMSINRILSWFENLNQYQYKGLTLTFNPQKRDLSQNVTIQTIAPKAS